MCPWCQFPPPPTSSHTEQPKQTYATQEQPEITQAEQKTTPNHETSLQESIQGPNEPTTPLHSDDSTTDIRASPKKAPTPTVDTPLQPPSTESPLKNIRDIPQPHASQSPETQA